MSSATAEYALLEALHEYEHATEVQFRARRARARAIASAIEAGEDAYSARERIYREIRLAKKHRAKAIMARGF